MDGNAMGPAIIVVKDNGKDSISQHSKRRMIGRIQVSEEEKVSFLTVAVPIRPTVKGE